METLSLFEKVEKLLTGHGYNVRRRSQSTTRITVTVSERESRVRKTEEEEMLINRIKRLLKENNYDIRPRYFARTFASVLITSPEGSAEMVPMSTTPHQYESPSRWGDTFRN